MIFLTLDQLLRLHALSIHRYGGSTGVRDVGRLEAVLATQAQEVFGEELYPTLGQKAAVMMRNIIADHPFVDGNKRTASLAAITLIELNGCSFRAEIGEIEDFAVQVAVEHLEIEHIAAWLEERSNDGKQG